MTAISGSAAAVTGAASGIGRALALELAARGCDLALADRDEAGLQQVAAEIARDGKRKVSDAPRRCRASPARSRSSRGRDKRPSLAEHRHQQCRRRAARPVQRDRPGADGLAVQHQFLGHGARRPARSCRIWRAQPAAHIVNLSSIFGIIAPPGQTAYCAAKFAVRGFSESLRHELAMANSPVRLSVVHPGGVSTNIARNSRTGSGVTDNARRAAIDRPLRCRGQNHAGGGGPAHHPGHREEPAAHFDRQRRAVHGPAATIPPGNLLGSAGEADREDDECGEVRKRIASIGARANARLVTCSAKQIHLSRSVSMLRRLGLEYASPAFAAIDGSTEHVSRSRGAMRPSFA